MSDKHFFKKTIMGEFRLEVLKTISRWKGEFDGTSLRRALDLKFPQFTRDSSVMALLLARFRNRQGWIEYAPGCNGVKNNARFVRTKKFPNLADVRLHDATTPKPVEPAYVPVNLSPLEARYRAFRETVTMPLTLSEATDNHYRE